MKIPWKLSLTMIGTHQAIVKTAACIGVLATTASSVMAQAINKDTTGAELTAGASWVGGVAPGAANTANWVNGSLGGALTVGSSVTWSNILFSGLASTPDNFLSGSQITLGNFNNQGTDTIKAGANNLTISNNLVVQEANIGTTGSGMVFAANSGYTLTINGGITLAGGMISCGVFSGNGTNVWNGTNNFVSTNTVTVSGNATLIVPSMTNAFAKLGLLRIGSSAGGGTLIYTGTGETNGLQMNYPTGTGGSTQTIQQDGASGVLKLTGNMAAGSSGFHNFVLQGSGVGEFAGQIQTSSGSITNVKAGSGTWTLSGSNLFTGGVVIRQGRLNIANSNALGAATGALVFDGSGGACAIDNVTGNPLTLPSYPQVWKTTFGFIGSTNLNLGNGNVTLTANSGVAVSNNILTVPSIISGGFGLSTYGPGTLVLGGSNTLTGGVSLNGGTVIISNNAAFGPGTLTFNGGCVVQSADSTARTITNSVTESGDVVFGGTGDFTFTGPIASGSFSKRFTVSNTTTLFSGSVGEGGSAAGNSNFKSGPGTLILTAYNNFTNKNLQIDAGTLRIAGSGSLGSGNYAGNLTINSLLDYNSSTNLLVNNGIAGTGSLLVSGSGKLILSGNNTYTGATTVTNGTLEVDGSLAATAVSVSGSGSILSGAGSIGGAVAVTNGATLKPRPVGGSATTLTCNSNLTLKTASANFTLDTSAFGANDLINFGSGYTLTLDSSDTINVSCTTLDTANDYTLFNSSGLGIVSMVTQPVLKINGVTSDQTSAGSYRITNSGSAILLHYLAPLTPPVVNSAVSSSDPVIHRQTVTLTVNVTPFTGKSVTNVAVTVDGFGGASDPVNLNGPGGNGAGNWTGSFTVAAGKPLGTLATAGVVKQNDGGSAPWSVNVTLQAASPVWSGNAADNKWSSNGNWNSGSGPAPGTLQDAVTFAGSTQTTANMDTNFSVTSLTFNSTAASFTITNASNTLTLAGNLENDSTSAQTLNVPVVIGSGQTINAAAGNLTLGQSVSGADLTVNGNNEVILTGNNTYSGGTTVSAGTLGMGSSTAIGSGALTMGGGNLDSVGANLTNANNNAQNWNADFGFVGSHSLNLGNGPVTLNTSPQLGITNTLTIGGVVSGSGLGLTKNGPGTLTLLGANTYSGDTTVNGGVFQVAGNGNLNSGNYSGNISINGSFEYSGSGNQTLNGSISGAGMLVKDTGTNMLILNGGNSYSGGTTISAGTIQIVGDSQLGTAPGVPTVNLTINGGTLYNNNSAPSLDANRTISLGANGGYLQPGWAQTITVNGLITGAGFFGINWDGGTVLLNSANTYQGNTAIGTAGPAYWVNGAANPALQLGIDNALPYGASAGNVVFGTSANNNTATLDLNGHNAQINGLSGSSNATIDNKSGTGAYTLTIGNNNAGGTFAGVIKNTSATGGSTLALTKVGTNIITLSGANTYNGNTTINGGTLALSTVHAGTNGIVVNGGATLKVTVSGTNQLVPSSLILGSGVNGGTNTFSGITSTTIAPVNVGTLSVTGACVINIATKPPGVGSYPLIVAGTSNGTGSLTLGALPPGLTANLVVSGSSPTTYSLNVTAVAPDAWAAGTGAWDITTSNWKSGGSPVIYANGDVTLFDDTASNSGPYTVSITPAAVTPSAVTVSNATKNYTITGYGIGGSAALTKTGNATLVLSGTNTYTGATYINGGVINAGIAQNGTTSGPLGANGSINFGGGTLQFSAATGAAWDPSARIAAGTSTGAVKLDLNGQGTSSGQLNFGTQLTASQSGGLVISDSVGTGCVYLSGVGNNYTGNTVINGGEVQFNADTSFGTGTLTVNGGSLVPRFGYRTLTNPVIVGGNFAAMQTSLGIGANSIQLNGTLNLGGAMRTITVQQNSLICSNTVSNGGLTKAGAGLMVLGSGITYTGNTVVSAGTLEIAQAAIATTSTVSVSNAALLRLDFATVNQVGALVLGGTNQPNGVYNAANSPGYIAGTGSLQVGTGPSGPASLTNSVSGSTLSLSWPAGQGWRLQMQTNSLSTGLGTNWNYVTDGSTSSTNITIDISKPTVFYRLTYP